MNSIDQNSEKVIRLLAAQRKEYSNAKLFSSLQIILSIISVIFAFVSIYNPLLKSTFSILSVVLLIVDFFLFQRFIKKYRESGAKIQEAFDCAVLNIKPNVLKIGETKKSEDIFNIANNYKKTACLSNWYYDKVQNLPTPFKEILSIRSNLYWDSFLRKRYMYYTSSIFLLVISIILICAYFENKNFIDSIATLIAPLSAFLSICFKIIFENKEASEKLDKLYIHVDKLLSNAKKGQTDFEKDFRNVQDEIYEGRKKNILVPDFIHYMLEKKIESHLYPALDEEIAEILKLQTSQQSIKV